MELKKISNYLSLFTFKNFIHYLRVINERVNGLDFSLIVSAEESGLDPKRSSPTNTRDLKNILNYLSITENDSVLDIGCGKGKALYTMMSFPFKKIDGIELSDKISRIASANMSILKETDRCNIFQCDARDFKNYADYNIFYLYNPFPSQIMNRVINQIAKTIKADSEIIIIYNNPTCGEEIEAVGLFNEIATFKSEWNCDIKIYSTFKEDNTRFYLKGYKEKSLNNKI